MDDGDSRRAFSPTTDEAGGRDPSILAVDTVAEYLRGRGLVPPETSLRVAELGGGVSNVVLEVVLDPPDVSRIDGFVVKQALPRLRVADEWFAKRERALTEAEAMRWAGSVTGSLVPPVYDVDPDRCVLVIGRAPDAWVSWKTELQEGRADAFVAWKLGEVLGTWHRESVGRPESTAIVDDPTAFLQLRMDPYYRTVMRRRPELASTVGRYVDRMLSTRTHLVHGDFSPKNVLIGPDGLWVLDLEVAHRGDPAFDLAFMVNHLMLKTIYRPSAGRRLKDCAYAFLEAYRRLVGEASVPDEEYMLGQTGCLMVARVDGKSPVEYLTERGRLRACDVGTSLLTDPPKDLGSAWDLLIPR